MSDPKRVYSDDEVKAILSRAIDRQRARAASGDGSQEGLSHDELLAVARDAGIPADAIDAAAAEVTAGREVEADARAIRKERASAFRIHLFTYVPIIAFLVFVNVLTTVYPWAIWPALGWGLALALHARFALFPTEVEIAHDVRRRAERRRRAEEKRRRREAKSALREGARELGHAVERGVTVMLTETAKRIHEEIGPVAEAHERRVRVEEKKGRDRREEDAEEEEEREDRDDRKAKR